VLPVLVGLLPNSISDHITKFLPSAAGGAFVTTHPDAHSLAPYTGRFALISTQRRSQEWGQRCAHATAAPSRVSTRTPVSRSATSHSTRIA
jgi:hypothetical protein